MIKFISREASILENTGSDHLALRKFSASGSLNLFFKKGNVFTPGNQAEISIIKRN